ncbi:META domain-containing protein [Nocardioides sambongensis]|uniref:META domain-containing protein n=1 Tax=Nocardioides sambongensis TaxID=2589074 RepID=UPI001127C938|nr:META domain-containing protein [Nocardioides sambongensis]
MESARLDSTDRPSVQVAVEGDRISVDGGCNAIGGTAEIIDGALRVAQLSSTKMACGQGLMALEEWLGGFLASEPAIELDEDVLVLTSGDDRLELPEVQADQTADRAAAEMLGTWQLESLTAERGGVASGSGSSDYAATLVVEDGQVLIDTGCNTGSASLSVVGDTWETGPVQMTLKGCRPADAATEQQITEVIDSSPVFAVSDGTLTLTTPDGTLGLQLRAAATP